MSIHLAAQSGWRVQPLRFAVHVVVDWRNQSCFQFLNPHVMAALFILVVGLFIGIVQCHVDCNLTRLDRCYSTIQPLLVSPNLIKGFASTKEAIQEQCDTFKVAMSCFNQFKDQCPNQRIKSQLERSTAAAKHTFTFLCDDPVFQAEFLHHRSCLKSMSEEFHSCAARFKSIVEEEMAAVNVSRAERNLGLCCAKHGFLRCVYYLAQFKCRKDGALFLMRVAQTLSESKVHENACKRIKFDEDCTSDSSVTTTSTTSFWLLVLLLLAISAARTR